MKEHSVPGFIVNAITGHEIGDQEYYLYGCGRAIAFIRMAADELEDLGNRQKTAEYHAYIGISASRTAIDAAANWLRIRFGIQESYPFLVDFAKPNFIYKLTAQEPKIRPCAKALGDLVKEIDPQRQRAQHREGLALQFYKSKGWYITNGLQTNRKQDKHLPTLLRKWADQIEEQVCKIIQTLGL